MAGTELPYSFRGHCEKIAVDERHRLNLKAFEPLSGERLAESLEITIVTPEQLLTLSPVFREVVNQTVWGSLIKGPGLPPVLLIRADQPPARRQSTLMHEIAHHLLNHAEDDIARVLSGAGRDKLQEAEASYLGGCLQIPRTGLLWASQAGLSRARTATHFGASEEMVRWRCNATGIRL